MRRPASLLIILSIFLPVMGVLLILQEGTPPIEKLAAVNMICGGLFLGYVIFFRSYKNEEGLNFAWVIWVNVFTLFQLWALMPIYIAVSEKWKIIIRKICKCFFIGFGILVLFEMIRMLISAQY